MITPCCAGLEPLNDQRLLRQSQKTRQPSLHLGNGSVKDRLDAEFAQRFERQAAVWFVLPLCTLTDLLKSCCTAGLQSGGAGASWTLVGVDGSFAHPNSLLQCYSRGALG